MRQNEKNVTYNRIIDRLRRTGVDVRDSVDIVIALETEIDNYREKIARMQAYIDGVNMRESNNQSFKIEEDK